MSYRVIQWASGSVGSNSLRSIVKRPDMELVGAFVYSAEKAGRDIGEICDTAPTGVIATNDMDAILKLDADCVVYNALGETRDPAKAVDDICALLTSGKNVVSTAVSRHIHPTTMPADARTRIEAACKAGGVTFHAAGINPGFSFDILPICLSAIMDEIGHVHCKELVDMVNYTSRHMVHDHIGMGRPPEYEAPMDRPRPFEENAFAPTARLVEDAFGIKFDDVRITKTKVVTDKPLDLAWGRIEAGTVAVRLHRMEGIIAGRVRFTWDLVWRVSHEVALDWPSGHAGWEVVITGNPNVTFRFDATTDKGRHVSLVTAMNVLNTVPAVIAAAPGIVTRLDLPLRGGGVFSA